MLYEVITSEVWDMTMHVYPKDESICDGYVNYYDTPNPTFFQLSGVAGFSHPQTPVVITSYSIHYTKLYESRRSRTKTKKTD